MRTAIVFVEGVLLAAIIATWMWTWWWNRYVVTHPEEPDYDAAIRVLTLALIRTPRPLHVQRKAIARKVVDAANREEKP